MLISLTRFWRVGENPYPILDFSSSIGYNPDIGVDDGLVDLKITPYREPHRGWKCAGAFWMNFNIGVGN